MEWLPAFLFQQNVYDTCTERKYLVTKMISAPPATGAEISKEK